VAGHGGGLHDVDAHRCQRARSQGGDTKGGGGARKAPATEPDVCALGWNPAKELSALERWAVTGTKRQFRTYGDGTARGESQMRSRHARTRTEPLFIAHRYDDAVG